MANEDAAQQHRTRGQAEQPHEDVFPNLDHFQQQHLSRVQEEKPDRGIRRWRVDTARWGLTGERTRGEATKGKSIRAGAA